MPLDLDATNPINSSDMTWLLVCTAAVFFMSPAVGYFYSGLLGYKNSLFIAIFSFLIYSIQTIRWYLFGFSLALSDTSQNSFIGDFYYAGGSNDMLGMNKSHPLAKTVPIFVFMLFYGTTMAITPIVYYGAVAERTRVFPFLVFSVLWATLVFDPVTYWTVHPNGWLIKWGTMDFAGGFNVHVNIGAAALGLALALGKRKNPTTKPHNIPLTTLGVAICWFGWMFFNGGSMLALNVRTAISIFNTNLGGCMGAMVWMATDYYKTRKYSAVGLCNGIFAGLVCVTPASGFIQPHYSLVFGAAGALVCRLGLYVKEKFGYDDTLDVIPIHLFGGSTGLILTGIFAHSDIFKLTGDAHHGGAVSGNPKAIGIQIVAVLVVASWSFFWSFTLAKLMSFIPFLSLRSSEQDEKMGCDLAYCNEYAYQIITPDIENGSQQLSSPIITKQDTLKPSSTNRVSPSDLQQ